MSRPLDHHLTERELLRQAEWLRRLIRHLVSEPDERDEVFQETCVAALGQRSRPRERESSRSWLAGVARNLTRMRRRREERRARREMVAARPESLPSAAEVAERLQLQRIVVECLLELDEPYRSTLSYRFYQDLPPHQIAELLGVPAGTVRARVHRGLAQLRIELERRLGKDHWQALLLPLLELSRPVAVTVPLTAASVLTGVLVVKKALLVAIPLAVVAGGWLLTDWATRPAPPPRTTDAPVTVADESRTPAVEEPTARTPVEPTPPTSGKMVTEERRASLPVALPQVCTPPYVTGGTGSVLVELQGPDGWPSPREATVSLRVAAPGQVAETVAWEYLPSREEPLLEGKARFDDVPVGCLVQASVQITGRALPRVVVQDGPSQPGDQAKIVVLEDDKRLLSCRLVSRDGHPQALAWVRVCRYRPGHKLLFGGCRFDDVRTDDEGRLEYDVSASYGPGEQRRLSFRITSGSEERGILVGGVADIDIGKLYPPGKTDIGDVTVRIPPILLAGRVEDEEGNPMSRVTIMVAGRLRPGGAHDREAWENYPDLSTDSRVDGSFSIPWPRDVASKLRVATMTMRSGYAECVLADVLPGRTDLLFRLGKGGQVEGRIIVDAGVAPQSLLIEVMEVDGRKDSVRADESGRFVAKGLTSGTVDLSVKLYLEELRRIDGVIVNPPGEGTVPVAIDLRGELRALLLKLVDADGKPVAGKAVMVLPVDGSGSRRGYTSDAQGKLDLVVPRSQESFLVWTWESRAVDVVWRPTRQEVRLLEGIPVRVAIKTELPVLPPDLGMFMELLTLDEPIARSRTPGRQNRAASLYNLHYSSNEVSGRVQSAGIYVPRVWLWWPISTGSAALPLPLNESERLHVQDLGSAEQRFVISLLPEAVKLIREKVAAFESAAR
ncbi:MAG: RNA polymerase sigma factor [Planctomycetota bacterium]